MVNIKLSWPDPSDQTKLSIWNGRTKIGYAEDFTVFMYQAEGAPVKVDDYDHRSEIPGIIAAWLNREIG